jgi:hypothetical protein
MCADIDELLCFVQSAGVRGFETSIGAAELLALPPRYLLYYGLQIQMKEERYSFVFHLLPRNSLVCARIHQSGSLRIREGSPGRWLGGSVSAGVGFIAPDRSKGRYVRLRKTKSQG